MSWASGTWGSLEAIDEREQKEEGRGWQPVLTTLPCRVAVSIETENRGLQPHSLPFSFFFFNAF